MPLLFEAGRDAGQHALPGRGHAGRRLPPARRAAALLDRLHVRHERQPGPLPRLRVPGAASLHGRCPDRRGGRPDHPLRGGAAARRLERRSVRSPERGRPFRPGRRLQLCRERAHPGRDGAVGTRWRTGHPRRHRRRDQLVRPRRGAVADPGDGSTARLRRPRGSHGLSRHEPLVHAGLGRGSRRHLPVHALARRDGPGLRSARHLAPPPRGLRPGP